MNAFKNLTATLSLAAICLAAPLALANEASEAAAQGRSNEKLSAEEEATTMPTNPNTGAGSVGVSGDPYSGGRGGGEEADDEYDYDAEDEHDEGGY